MERRSSKPHALAAGAEASNRYTCPAGRILAYEGKEQQGPWLRYRYRALASTCQSCTFKAHCS